MINVDDIYSSKKIKLYVCKQKTSLSLYYSIIVFSHNTDLLLFTPVVVFISQHYLCG